jgi:hypothetical protein
VAGRGHLLFAILVPVVVGLETGKLIGTSDRFIHGWIVGTLPPSPNRVWLSLQLYWKPARQPSIPVVAACHASVEKGVVLSFKDVSNRPSSIRLGPLFRKGDSRLFLEAGDSFDPDEAFQLLLESADEALAMTIPPDSASVSASQADRG